jgi:hypothetical protein
MSNLGVRELGYFILFLLSQDVGISSTAEAIDAHARE